MDYTANLELVQIEATDARTPESFNDFFSGNPEIIDEAVTRLRNRAAAIETVIGNVPVTNFKSFSLVTSDWQDVTGMGEYHYAAELSDTNASAQCVFLRTEISPEQESVAGAAGLWNAAKMGDGTITLYAKSRPTEEINGTVHYIRNGTQNSAIFTAYNTSGFLAKTVAQGSALTLSFNWNSLQDDNITGAGTIRVTVNGTTRAILRNVAQGAVSLDVGEYITTGENIVRVTIADVYDNSQTFAFTITCIALSINSAFNTETPFTGGIIFSYTPVGAVNKTLHFLLDGRQFRTEETAISGRQMSLSIPAQTHGAHSLEVYFDCLIGGDAVESNHLYYEMICLEDGNNTPIIVSPYHATTIPQYGTVQIPYTVYNPTSMSADVTIVVNDVTAQTVTVDRTVQTFAQRVDTAGALSVTITSGTATKRFALTVTETVIDAPAETDGLALYLSSAGRSNNEANPGVWTSGTVEAVFTNFNWRSDGWQPDADGITVLRVSGNARLTIPYQMFAEDFRGTGKTIEVEFATRDVRDYDAVILSCVSGGRGLVMTAQQATLTSEQSSISMQYKEDEHVRVTFVAEKRSENRLLYVYVDGILSGTVQYPDNDDFSQATPVGISIGSNLCAVDLYCIRVYDNDLTRHQVLNNWIADTRNLSEMLSRYSRNRIYDEYGTVVIANLPSDLPYMTITAEELPQYKGDKKTVSVTYVDPVNPARSFSAENVQIDVQGTSSQYYARKNYKIKFKQGLTMTATGSTVSTYPLRATGAVATDAFCLKADVASSEGANNVELARLYNDTCPYKTPPQVRDSNVRQGIDGFPIVVFWDDGANTSFLGKYNFNNDKGTENVFGFVDGDESWEIKNNTGNRPLFKDSDYTGDGWLNDFEGRFPDGNEDPTNLSAFAAWVVATDRSAATGDALSEPVTYAGVTYTTDTAEYRLAKFKAELDTYGVRNALEFYYLFTELFLMVDSRAKNAFPTAYLSSGGKWFSLPYDFDTALGINNEGALVFGYSLEDTDHLTGGADVFNGQNSTLWCNLRDTFGDEIAAMYRNLRSTGALSYARVEGMFEEHQGKWPEAIFNEDAQFKYIDPLIQDGSGAYLAMCQGSKTGQRRWWLFHRFRYMDSKYHAGDALSDVVQLRGYAKSNVTLTPYADVYVTVKFGSYLVQTRGARDNPYTIVCPLDNVNDTEIYLYSASLLADVGDLSGLKVGYADFSMATKLQNLQIGSVAAGYDNANMQELYLGNNTLLQTLDVRNCSGLGTGDMKSVDLSGCTNIEFVYFDGTNITGLALPDGGILKTLHLPSTITNLTIINQPFLEEFVMPSYANISTLRLENVGSGVNPLAILQSIPANSRVRLVGFTMEATDAQEISDLFDVLDAMRGLDEHGNNMPGAQVSGTIHTSALTGAEIAEFNARYPYVTVTADHTTTYLRYYNYDGSTLLHTETVQDGGNGGEYSTQPTRTATAQYTYTFVGWSTQQDAQTAEANVLNAVTTDRNVYAAYSRTVRTYTVTWKNSNGTVLETDSNVPYGTTPTYNGATPTQNGETAQGWTPAISAVTGDAIYTASYVPVYTVTFYNGSTLLETVTVRQGGTATYSGTTPVSSDADDGAFEGWNPAPTNVQANLSCYATYASTLEVAEIADSWDQIIAKINAGTATYKVGNYKPLDLGTEGIVNMQICGKNKDLLADGSGNTATYSWLSKELLATNHRMNPSYSTGTEGTGTLGGWEKTEMRSWLKDTVKPLIPATVAAAIKPVTKYSRIYNTAGTAVNNVTSTEDVWIPSAREVGVTGYETEGSTYASAFNSEATRVKRKAGASSVSWWWLRSAYNANNFSCVFTGGSSGNNTASTSGAVALGFCT